MPGLSIDDMNRNMGVATPSAPSNPGVGLSIEQMNALMATEQKQQDATAQHIASLPSQTMYKDGNPYTVAGADVPRALSLGYTPETQDQLIQRDQAYIEQQRGIGGSLAEGAKSFANQFLLGVPKTFTESGLTREQQLRLEETNKQHQLAQGIGGGLGFAGSIALTEGASSLLKAPSLAAKGVEAAEVIGKGIPKVAEALGGTSEKVGAPALRDLTATEAADAVAGQSAVSDIPNTEGWNVRAEPTPITKPDWAISAEPTPITKPDWAISAEPTPITKPDWAISAEPTPITKPDWAISDAERAAGQALETPEDGAALANKAAEQSAQKSFGTRMVDNMVENAKIGAAYAAPQAFAQALVGDPDKAAETLAWGLGGGLFFGAAGELVSSAASATKRAAEEGLSGLLESQKVKDGLENFANGAALKLQGFNKPMLKKLSIEQIADRANYIFENGLNDSSKGREALIDMTEELHNKTGAVIGEGREAIKKVLVDNPTINYSPPESLTSVLRKNLDVPELNFEHNAELKRAVDSILRDGDSIDRLNLHGEYGNAVIPEQIQALQKFTESLRGKWAENLKKFYANGSQGLQIATPIDLVRGQAYGITRNYMIQMEDNIVKAAVDAGISIDPTLIKTMAKARRDYSILLDIEGAQQDMMRRDIANKTVGLTDSIRAGHGIPSALAGGALAAVGHATGIPGAGWVGYHAGRVLGAPLDIMAKHWLEGPGLMMASNAAKRAAKEGPQVFNAFLVSEGKLRLEKTLSQINDVITRSATKAVPPIASMTHNPVSHLLGPTNLSTEKQRESVLTKLNNFQTNPDALVNLTSHMTGGMAEFSPQLAEAYHNQVSRQVQYLASVAPKIPQQMPFGPKPPPISAQAWKDFSDKAEVALNPMAVMHHYERNTLTDSHVQALNTVYPKIKGDIVAQIGKTHLDNPKLVLSNQKRQMLTKLTGVQMSSPSGNDIQKLWASINPNGEPQPQGQSTPKSSKTKIDLSSVSQNTTYSQLSANKSA